MCARLSWEEPDRRKAHAVRPSWSRSLERSSWRPAPRYRRINGFTAAKRLPTARRSKTPATSKLLKDELPFQHATQIYLWALPLINTLGMKIGSEKAFGAGYDILPVWKKRLDVRIDDTWKPGDIENKN